MTGTYLGNATAAMQTLNANWFTPSTPWQWGGGGNFWRTPTICMGVLDYMTLSGTQDYIQTVENTRTAGEGYIGNCGFYDDATCWGRFYVSGYSYFNATESLQHYAPNYLSDAQAVYQDLVNGWDDVCGGGLWWRRDPKSYPGNVKAANSTLGLMEIALGLYGATQDQSCLEWAQKCWNWIEQSGLVAGGLVLGGLTQACIPDPHNGPVVGLQGNPLGPLWSLYEATANTGCIDAACNIVEATIHQMTWPTAAPWAANQAIIQARADVGWNAGGPAFHDQWGDEMLFKGIFIGYLGAFTQGLAGMEDSSYRTAAQEYAQVLAANADALAANFPGGVYGMDWHTPQPDYQPDSDATVNACLQYCGLAAFVAAARTSG